MAETKPKKLGIGTRVVYLLATIPLSVRGMTVGDIFDALGVHSGTDVTRRLREKRPQGFVIECNHKTNRYQLSADDRARVRASDGYRAWVRAGRRL